MTLPLPQQTAPSLTFPLTSGGQWSLDQQHPDNFTCIIFYRGLHCPVCKSYNQKFQSMLDDFAERGVKIVAVSMDDKEHAEETVREWGLDKLEVGYGLEEDDARRWGLYLSHGISDKEPDIFSEPGLFLVKPDGTLYYSAINSMPFGRPDPQEMLGGIGFVEQKDYPARGEATKSQDALAAAE